MSDYVRLDGSDIVFDAESGEIVSECDINDAVKFIASKRHGAKEQEEEWGKTRKTLDIVLKRHQDVGTNVVYGDLVVAHRTSGYSTFDAPQFRDAISEIEFTKEELMALVMAAKSFDRDLLPMVVQDAYDEAVTAHTKQPWIESRIVRKQAPRLSPVAREAVEV